MPTVKGCGCGLVWSAGAVGKALGIAEIILTGLRASVGFALDICTDGVKAVVRNEYVRKPWSAGTECTPIISALEVERVLGLSTA